MLPLDKCNIQCIVQVSRKTAGLKIKCEAESGANKRRKGR